MDLRFSDDDERFRAEIRAWLEERLEGEYRHLRGRGGPGREHEAIEPRLAWERELGAAGWIGLGWPSAAGAAETAAATGSMTQGRRGASLWRQVIFHEEYARARAPGRFGHIGEYLLGPTVAALGTPEQQRRFLPAIARGEQIWCQGYSEPGAGSDLAGIATRATPDGGEWRIDGQKIWTSHAHNSDWCFVLARSDPPRVTDQGGAAAAAASASKRHAGLSYLLVPMRQPGITVRPIKNLTGTAEFCEVFFDGARTAADNIVGAPGDGWKVAMATLAFERGASTLGQQIGFAGELDQIIAAARQRGADRDPELRRRIADAWIGLRVMRSYALRVLAHGERGELSPAGLGAKLYWSNWHRRLGELAMDVLGPEAEIIAAAPYSLTPLQETFLFSRADTIYAGSNEIQRNIIATRALGLPRS